MHLLLMRLEYEPQLKHVVFTASSHVKQRKSQL